MRFPVAVAFSDRSFEYAKCGGIASNFFPSGSWRAKHDRVELLTDTHHLPYWDPKRLTYVEHQNGIDRRTGTAADRKLFTSEVVPAGLPFRVRLIVDHSTKHVLPATKQLLRALAGFNLDPVHAPIQLGSGTQHGWGRMACVLSTVQVRVWSPDGCRDVETDELDIQSELCRGLENPPKPRNARIQVGLRLTFQGPLLVDDPAKVAVLQAVRSGGEQQGGVADQVPRVAGVCIQQNTEGRHLLVKPLLPGTYAKGPLRAQIERILRTLCADIQVSPHGGVLAIDDNSLGFVKELLGYQSHRSGLWCSEFVGEQDAFVGKDERNGWAHREMVAIDRFTGGAADHAKYDAVVLDRPVLEGALAVDLPHKWDEAQKTLGTMILMLRDLVEGDVTFGLGSTKGFGQCVAEIHSLRIAGLDIDNFSQEYKKKLQSLCDTKDTPSLAHVQDQLDKLCETLANRHMGENTCHEALRKADELLIDPLLSSLRESLLAKKETENG